MKPDDFQKLLAALGMNASGAAKFLTVDPRTIRRWIAGLDPVPAAVAMLLAVIQWAKVSPHEARAFAGLPPIDGELNRPPGRPAAEDQRHTEKPNRRRRGKADHKRQDERQDRDAGR